MQLADIQTLSLAEIRNETGFKPEQRFVSAESCAAITLAFLERTQALTECGDARITAENERDALYRALARLINASDAFASDARAVLASVRAPELGAVWGTRDATPGRV